MESNKYIVVKFSELFLKGSNKREFIFILVRNIKIKLINFNNEFNLFVKRDKIEIHSKLHIENIYSLLSEVVGISSWYYCYEFNEFNKNEIENVIENELTDHLLLTKFRVNVKIINNHLIPTKNKEEIINWLASFCINKLNFEVDLKKYDVKINLRFEKNKIFLFFLNEKGIEGLPAGVNGRALALLSGGIDSPVAAFRMISRGINVSFITFLTPNTSEENTLKKIKELALRVDNFNGIHGKIFFVNFEKIQEKIMQLKNSSYRIILLRRAFMKFSKIVSKKYGYKFLITGDSLGQVASQTPESMSVINQSIDQLIVRPLISMSKNEIIKIANDINTYKISIQPGNDMCINFTPKNPIIFPKKIIVENLEREIGDIEQLFYDTLKENTRIVDINDFY